MRKICSTALAIMMIASMNLSAFATEADFVGVEPATDVVGICENVETKEALLDDGFSLTASRQRNDARGATWELGAERDWKTVNGVYGATPKGWSQQVNTITGNVENTYHYTNVYFNIWGGQRGGSGRVWGHGRVSATGSFCLEEVALLGTLTVKYGVSDD